MLRKIESYFKYSSFQYLFPFTKIDIKYVRSGVLDIIIEENTIKKTYTFNYPIFTIDYSYELEGIVRYIPSILTPSEDFDYEHPHIDNMVAYDPYEVAIRFLFLPALGETLLNYKKRKSDFLSLLYSYFISNITTSEITRILDKNVTSDKIYILLPEEIKNEERFRLPFMATNPNSGIDLASLSISGNNCGLLVDKSGKIEYNTLYPTEESFGNTLQNGICLTQNRRPHILRTVFEAFEVLVSEESPLVLSTRNDLSGVNLNSAVMIGEYNHFDAIQISQTGANKLKCIRSFKVSCPVVDAEIKVKVRQTISPGNTVFYDPEKMQSYKYNGPVPAVVSDINTFDRRSVVDLVAIYPFTSGDKLCTRSGYKGVAKVVPDEEMPKLKIPDIAKYNSKIKLNICEDDDQYYIPDALFNPIGICNRRNISMLMEMATSWDLLTGILSHKAAPEYAQNIENIVSFGKYKGKEIENITIGSVFVVRVNKHAIEASSNINDMNVFSPNRTISDNTINGQRINLTNLLVLLENFEEKDILSFIQDNIYVDRLKAVLEVFGYDLISFLEEKTSEFVATNSSIVFNDTEIIATASNFSKSSINHIGDIYEEA